MIIWKGLGIIAVILPIIFMFIIQLITNMLFGDGFYKDASWTLSLALFLSAISVYLIGIKLNNKIGQIVIDKETGQEIELKNTHSLFWIPLQYWGFILFGIGAFVLISKAMQT